LSQKPYAAAILPFVAKISVLKHFIPNYNDDLKERRNKKKRKLAEKEKKKYQE
jgi:hypothetical protein